MFAGPASLQLGQYTAALQTYGGWIFLGAIGFIAYGRVKSIDKRKPARVVEATANHAPHEAAEAPPAAAPRVVLPQTPPPSFS